MVGKSGWNSLLPPDIIEKVIEVSEAFRVAAVNGPDTPNPKSQWVLDKLNIDGVRRAEIVPLLVYLLGVPPKSSCYVYSETDEKIVVVPQVLAIASPTAAMGGAGGAPVADTTTPQNDPPN